MDITVIGGDLRIVELIKILVENGNTVALYGLEKCDKIKELKHLKSIQEAFENSDTIITSIPLSKDGKFVNSPYSDEKIYVGDIFKLAKNKKIITGNITEEINKYIDISNNNEIVDILKYEDLTILNAIPTAEGAIQIAMEKSNITLHNSNCLVMGFGRIGKILSKMLSGIGAKVSCEARKQTDIAYIKSYGYNAIDLKNLNENLNQFDFIFNTIPFVILDECNLKNIKKECVLIDLASKPGGIDFEKAKEIGLKTEWALALPRKSSTKNCGKLYI